MEEANATKEERKTGQHDGREDSGRGSIVKGRQYSATQELRVTHAIWS